MSLAPIPQYRLEYGINLDSPPASFIIGGAGWGDDYSICDLRLQQFAEFNQETDADYTLDGLNVASNDDHLMTFNNFPANLLAQNFRPSTYTEARVISTKKEPFYVAVAGDLRITLSPHPSIVAGVTFDTPFIAGYYSASDVRNAIHAALTAAGYPSRLCTWTRDGYLYLRWLFGSSYYITIEDYGIFDYFGFTPGTTYGSNTMFYRYAEVTPSRGVYSGDKFYIPLTNVATWNYNAL